MLQLTFSISRALAAMLAFSKLTKAQKRSCSILMLSISPNLWVKLTETHMQLTKREYSILILPLIPFSLCRSVFLHLTVEQFLHLKEVPEVVLRHNHCDVANPKGAAASPWRQRKRKRGGQKPHQHLRMNIHHPPVGSAFRSVECKCKYIDEFLWCHVGV